MSSITGARDRIRARMAPGRRPKFHRPLVIVAGLMTFGSGVLNLISAAGRSLPERHALLREVFPLEFIHLSRFLTLLIGFALVISSRNIFKRKKRALAIVLLLSGLSVFFHLTKGLDYEEAAFSLVLMAVLVLARKSFTVKSNIPDLRASLLTILLAAAAAFFYGTLGFWLLDKRDFGINFTVTASVRFTASALAFVRDAALVPRTRFAVWFLDSLNLISAAAILYALYALFRPFLYRHRILAQDRARAAEITEKHGRSSLDPFKLAGDKVYFFSPSGQTYLAYGMAGNFAVVLADPVGPEPEIPGIIREFKVLCEDNDWRLAFHQVLPDFLPQYKAEGFRKLKIGEDAIVDLGAFSLEGHRMKHIRHYLNSFDRAGIRLTYYDPPLGDEIMTGIREVSDDWLKIPGRRERCFTMGTFAEEEIRRTPVFAAAGPDGRILAFMNVIRSYAPGETTIDLMRHRRDAPDGIMDGLFVRLFELQRERGFTRFSLGMAPMSGFREGEEAGAEERAVQFFLQRLSFLFSYSGLYQYKAKFATHWEPRYTVYRNVIELPRLAIALGKVSGVEHGATAYD